MKSYSFILVLVLSLVFFSCTDTLSYLGTGIQPSSDEISIGADTFHLSTQNVFINSINMTMNPDSFLLGNYDNIKYKSKYGSLRAGIFAALNAPADFKLEKKFVMDSARVYINFNSYFGDALSPLEVSVYEMTKNLNYTDSYSTDMDPNAYADLSKVIGKRVFAARTLTGVYIPLTTEFVKRFYPITSDTAKADYYSPEKFREFFKGIYVKTNYGSSTMLNVSGLGITYHYHYTYTEKTSANKDTTITVNDVIPFPASNDVRQVNGFSHYNRDTVALNANDTVNYISSPANMQTRVNIPLKSIQDKLSKSPKLIGKRQIINNATIQVGVAEMSTTGDTLEMPAVKYLLLVKESAADRFFKKKELPSDTCAILGSLTASQIGTTGVYRYYYSFDVSGLIANELVERSEAISQKRSYVDNLKLKLIPVQVSYNSSGYMEAVKHQNSLSGVMIKSGKNKSPMTLKMVYSGF